MNAETEPTLQSTTVPLQWRRAHWLSPITRLWVIIALMIWNFWRDLYDDWQEAQGDLQQFLTSVDPFGLGAVVGIWALPLVAFAAILIFLTFTYWGWFFTRFAVDDEAVHLKKGVIFRTYRQANLERIQSVDITQPLLPRLLGLAQVNIDVADGSSNALAIQFLSRKDAEQLRSVVLRLVREAKVVDGGSRAGDSLEQATESVSGQSNESVSAGRVAAEPETQLTFLPTRRLIASIALSPKMWGYVLFSAVFIASTAIATGNFWGAIFGNLAVSLVTLSVLWADFNNGYKFRISHGIEGLKIHRGFLNTISQSVPTGRIQALEIHQPLTWKRFGWYSVKINVAGYGISTNKAELAKSNLMVAATAQEISYILPYVIEQRWGAHSESAQFLGLFSATQAVEGFQLAPRSSKWFDPLSYRRNGYRVTEHFLLIRRGLVTHRLTVVPHNCVQSVELKEGLIQRRLHLATVSFHSVAGQIDPRAKNISTERAHQLISQY